MATRRYMTGLPVGGLLACILGLGCLSPGHAAPPAGEARPALPAPATQSAPPQAAAPEGAAPATNPADAALLVEPPLPPPWQQAPPPAPADADRITRGLHEIARAVTCMVDGDLVHDVITERAEEKAFTIDPRDQWAAGDNWDYNHEPFIRLKQTIQRAECLAPGEVGCNLFKPAAVKPKMWFLVIYSLHGGSQVRGKEQGMAEEPAPELLEVFRTGQRIAITKTKDNYSVLAPVYDSLGRIVAVVEVFTRTNTYDRVRK